MSKVSPRTGLGPVQPLAKRGSSAPGKNPRPKQLSAALDHSDSNGIHVFIENIRPVQRRLHELRVYELRHWALHHIF
jgi:hypothetical protein